MGKKSSKKKQKNNNKTNNQNTQNSVTVQPDAESKQVVETPNAEPEQVVETPNAEPEQVVETPNAEPEQVVETPNAEPKPAVETVDTEPKSAADSSETLLVDYGEEKKRGWKKTAGIILACVLVILAGVYIYFSYHYDEVLFKGTTINGIDCSDLSVSQAETLIKEKVEDYAFEIAYRDGTTDVIEGGDIAYEYVSSGEVQQILDAQENWNWISYVFSERTYTVEEQIQFDEDLLKTAYSELSGLQIDKRVEPADAYVTYDSYSFVVVPEEEGNSIRQVLLYDEVKKAISDSETSLNVEELRLYRRPTVYRDNKALNDECEQLNELAAVSITYVLPDGESVLDGNVVREWLTLDENGSYTITEDEIKEKVTEFVKNMASEVNTVGIDREFHATKQGDIVISGGSYGYKIDQKSEIKRVIEDLANHTVSIREPEYISKEVQTENGGLGDTYIELDLSNQHLWYYIDGKLYMESDLVSGTYYNSGRRTPGGVYLLTYKARNRVLRGDLLPDGTYSYECPVSYWMPFNGGIGLHDASWRGSFGGNIYLYSGSHGCINLPGKNAKLIYEKIDETTPIICYY